MLVFLTKKSGQYRLFLVTLQNYVLINMKNLFTIILLFTALSNIHCSTKLPWDSLFTAYGFTKSMAMIPTCISSDLNINYNDGYSAGIWGLTTPVARRYGLIVNNKIQSLTNSFIEKWRWDVMVRRKACHVRWQAFLRIYHIWL